MKYYIPTSTLNVSNILSSGSISPYSYYGKRQFGIKTFEPIKECEKFKDQIILFKKYPLFSIISDKESYPMCIEIEIPDNMVAQSNIPDICYACETIYISPKNVFFVFNSEEDLKKSLFWIEISDEAKFYDQYKDKFVLSDDKKDTFDLTTSTLKNLIIEKTPDIEKEILKDWKIDKIRGSLCGMFVGTNGFDGGDKTGVGYRRNKIKELISQLLYIFDGHDKLVSQTCLLQKSALSEFEKKEQSIHQLCSIQTDGRLDILYNEDNEVRVDFYNKLLNRILVNSETLTQQEVSQEGGKLLSTLYGNRWKGSPDYNYLIQLYNNVTRYDNFELNTNGSIILRSFSAFVQRGLGEWDKLRDYLNERNDTLPDRRFVYGLYGALNGFSTLSKTLTDTTDISDNAITDFINDINEESLIDVDIAFTEKEIKDSGKEEAIVTTPADDLGNKVKKIVASHPRIKISDNDRNTIEWAIDKAQNDGIVFINMIVEELGNPKKGIFPYLQKELYPNWKPTKTKQNDSNKDNRPKEASLFENITEGFSKMFGKSISSQEKVKFEFANINRILQIIMAVSPSITEKTAINIKKDLEWVLDPKYSEHKNYNELIADFQKHLVDGKTLKLSPNGKDLSWKNKLYADLDIDLIIKQIRDYCI